MSLACLHNLKYILWCNIALGDFMQSAVVFSATNAGLPVYSGTACKLVTGDNAIYYVTGQPTKYSSIANAGVRSVLCVRDPAEYDASSNPFDTGEADALILEGVSYTNVPLPHISMSQLQFNMQAFNAAVTIDGWKNPLLVHCSTGDRASAAFAVFMIQFCGWPNAQAVAFAQQQLALANAQFVQWVTAYTAPY
jgi:protein tyrosine phosphatase (PTP) superfamily phosphohydrolase (DUF442 family)